MTTTLLAIVLLVALFTTLRFLLGGFDRMYEGIQRPPKHWQLRFDTVWSVVFLIGNGGLTLHAGLQGDIWGVLLSGFFTAVMVMSLNYDLAKWTKIKERETSGNT